MQSTKYFSAAVAVFMLHRYYAAKHKTHHKITAVTLVINNTKTENSFNFM